MNRGQLPYISVELHHCRMILFKVVAQTYSSCPSSPPCFETSDLAIDSLLAVNLLKEIHSIKTMCFKHLQIRMTNLSGQLGWQRIVVVSKTVFADD